MLETKIFTHTKQQGKFRSVYFQIVSWKTIDSEQRRTMNSICSYFLQAIHFRHFKLHTIWHNTRWGYLFSQIFSNILPPQVEMISSLSMSGQNFWSLNSLPFAIIAIRLLCDSLNVIRPDNYGVLPVASLPPRSCVQLVPRRQFERHHSGNTTDVADTLNDVR